MDGYTCKKCLVTKPLTAEFFNRDSKMWTGFNSQCKVCKSAAARKQLLAKNPNAKSYKPRAAPKKHRLSPFRCGTAKDFDDKARMEKVIVLSRPVYSIDE